MIKTLTPSRRWLLGVLMWLLASLTALAQTTGGGTISGRIVDKKGEPVIGATVQIQGTAKGAATDPDGNFTIRDVPAGTYRVTVSSVGMNATTQDATVTEGGTASINATMAENTTLLNEAVVVGYGTQSRRELTGSVAQVKASAFENTPVPSFDAALQGRAVGVQVQQSNGVPGSQVRVRVRGQASISGNADPLYVLDGIPINNGDYTSKDQATSAISLNPLASIDPSEIESIEVLKDASAGAIYGARAANGVVIITTKRGKVGKTSFSVNYSTGVSEPARKLKFLNGSEYKQLFMEAYHNDSLARVALNPPPPAPQLLPLAFPTTIGGVTFGTSGNFGIGARRAFLNSNTNTNWFDQVFRTGRTQDASVSASGGTEKTKFWISGAYQNNQAFLKGNEFQRFSSRINVDHQANDRVTIGTSIGTYYTINDQVRTSYNGGLGAAQSIALPIFPVRNPDGSFFGTPNSAITGRSFKTGRDTTYAVTTGGAPKTDLNPVAQLNDKFRTTNLRSVSTIYLNLKLLPGLEFRTENSLDYFNSNELFYYSPTTRYFSNRQNKYQGLGAMQERNVAIYNLNTNNFFTYSKEFNENNRLRVTVGQNVQSSSERDLGYYPTSGNVGFADPYFTYETATASQLVYSPDAPLPTGTVTPVGGFSSRDFYRFAAFFGRANYTFRNRYVAEVSFRADGSNRFGANKRFGYFPAVSGAWIISDEAFLQDQTLLSLLKLRASYGITGNSELGGNFLYLGTYGGTASGINGYNNVSGFGPTKLANPDLQWERNKQYDIGLDYGVLNNRISGTVTYFRRTGDRILLRQPVQQSASGFENTAINSNVVIRNQGIELNVTSRNFVGDRFTWTTDLNMSFIRNKVVDAAGIPPDGFESGPGDSRVLEGKPVGTSYLYQWAGVNPQTGLEGIYVTSKVTGKRDSIVYIKHGTVLSTAIQKNDRVASGNPFPKFNGGFSNRFTYAGFDAEVLLVFSYGSTIYDDSGKDQNGNLISIWNQTAKTKERWTHEGQQTSVPKLTNTLTTTEVNSFNTTRYLYDASYLRVRQVQLGYSLPKSLLEKVHVDRMRFYVTGMNLLTWTKFPGWDPEVVRYANDGNSALRNNQANIAFGAPYLPTPQARTITVGVNLGF